jgi:hypothetical protein
MLRIQRQMEELSVLCYLDNSRDQESTQDRSPQATAQEMYNNLYGVLESFVKQTFDEWTSELKLEIICWWSCLGHS